MQPTTEPSPAARERPPTPRGDEGDLYLRHHRDLQRAVAHVVNAPRELIEDACQNAWAILLRSQPERPKIFGWLFVVATREAFRLSARERHVRLEAMLPDGVWEAVIADEFSIDDNLEARHALEILATLPDRQRADLTLQVLGFSYKEIAQLTGGRTYTNVNKHLAKARARIRLERLRRTTSPREQGGRVKSRQTRLLAPLAGDLAEFRIRCGRPDDHELVLGKWSGDDWDNCASASSNRRRSLSVCPTTRSPATCAAASRACSSSRAVTCSRSRPSLATSQARLDIYGRLFEEFDPARRRPAAEVIREARKAVREGTVPTGYPARAIGDAAAGRASAEDG